MRTMPSFTHAPNAGKGGGQRGSFVVCRSLFVGGQQS